MSESFKLEKIIDKSRIDNIEEKLKRKKIRKKIKTLS